MNSRTAIRFSPEDRSNLDAVETALEQAVCDAAQWPKLCDALARCFGGVGAVFIPVDPARRGPWLTHSPSLADALADYIEGGWHIRDYRQIGLAIMRERGFVTDLDFVDARTLETHPYYRDFLASHGLGQFIGIHVEVDGEEWCASIQRPLGHRPMHLEDERLAAWLRPLLSSALTRAHRIGLEQITTWKNLLASHDRGIAFLDRQGRVRDMNAVARKLVDEQGLLNAGSFALPDARDQRRLDMLLQCACDPAYSGALPAPVISAPRGGVSLAVDVVRLPPEQRHFTLDMTAALAFRLASNVARDPGEMLSVRYGLVPSEIRVVRGIWSGKTLRQIAAESGVTEGTVRQQLKSALRKTGLNRQIQLIALLNAPDAGAE